MYPHEIALGMASCSTHIPGHRAGLALMDRVHMGPGPHGRLGTLYLPWAAVLTMCGYIRYIIRYVRLYSLCVAISTP